MTKKAKADYKWYLSIRHLYNFDGTQYYVNKKGVDLIQFDKNGVTGFKAFFEWDANGKIFPTKHPRILHTLLKTKGSINLFIKMYAEDLAKGVLAPFELKELSKELKAPDWFFNACNQQKWQYV